MSGGIRKQLIQWGFLEHGHAQNLQKAVERKVDRHAFLDNRHEDINRDSHPDLSPDGVLGCSVECLDPEVLLDPTEEQLDLPTQFIEESDVQGWQEKVVRQEGQKSIVLPIQESNPTKMFGIFEFGFNPGQDDGLIADQVHRFIDGMRIEAAGLETRQRPNDEESSMLMKRVKAGEVHVPTIQHIEGSRFGQEFVEGPHIVDFSICHMDKRRDRSSQIEKGVKLNGCLVLTEKSPGEERQTEVNRGRVEGVNRVLEFESEVFIGIKVTGLGDEDLGEIRVDAPIASFVGMGQVVPGDVSPDPHVIEPALHRSQAGLDVAETLSIRELSKGQAEKLIQTEKTFEFIISAITANASAELMKRQEIHDLRKDGRRRIHRALLPV